MLLVILSILLVVVAWSLAFVFALSWWLPAAWTALVGALVLGRWLLARYRAARADREIERSLTAQAAQFEQRARPDQQAEVRALATQFEQALATLKSSKLAQGQGGALYTLPWYVIIGPPGAGKSTAIRQSGLQFPLESSQDSVRGIGGTRNCDWWLTNEAVLLDTAGRYATERDDRDEWFAFLDMLRRARPKRPLNGLIVAVSIAEVAAADERALAHLSACVRERIDEVMARLELRLPVYVLLTKCDLLPGFCESFEELRKVERQQVFGFTLPVVESEGDLAQRVEQQWTRLVQVSERRSLLRLGDVRGLEARRAVYEFPQQLETLCQSVSAFMAQTFVHNVYREAPVVRGVYLTSGTQEGSPIDRIMGSMASAFGLPPATEAAAPRTETKSYFLADLFRGVMFADRDLATPSAHSERRLRTARLLGAALVVVCALGSALYAASSYVANRESLQAAVDDVARAQGLGAVGDAATPLRVLEPIRARLSRLHGWSESGAPLVYRAGLYRGELMLPALRTFYTSALRSVLVQPLVDQLERGIVTTLQRDRGTEHAPSAHDHAWLYDRLKAYLLLTSAKEASEPALTPEHERWLTAQLVGAWVTADKGHASPDEQLAMTQHVTTYIELLASDPALGFRRDTTLVEGARALLARVPLVKLAVDRVVSAVDTDELDLTLEQLVGGAGLPLHASGRVRGAFTRRGWEEQVAALLRRPPPELLGDTWVLSSGATGRDDTQARTCALRSEYFARFIDEWRTFIGTLRVEEPAQHLRALVVLQDLTRGQPPPLERVVRAIAHNARLVDPARAKQGLEAKAEELGVLAQLTKRVQDGPAAQLLHEQDPCATGSYLSEHSVRRELEGFFAFGASWEEPAAGTTSPLTSVQIYQEQLSYLRDALQAYQDDPATADALLSRLASARTRVRSLIEAQPVGWRPRFDALLWPPVNGSSVSSTSAMAGEKGQQWCTSVVVPFGRTLREHYPFARHGQDAALADVADFYRPGSGILWGFYEATLKRDIAQVGARFERKPGASGGSMYTAELVRFLERSAHLSSVLFAPRAEKPGVEFEVRVRPSPGIAQVLVQIDGQQSDFHNGPERWFRFSWPGEGDQRQASLRIKGANIDETLVQEGEWGLFRLLDKGTLSVNPGERFFTVRFGLHTQHDVTLDVRPTRVDNPFVGAQGYLSAFRADGCTRAALHHQRQEGVCAMTVLSFFAPTLFGKLPTRGDFVTHGERGVAEATFAAWLTRAVEAARGKVPAPVVQFLARSTPGPSLVGSWVASRDAVGRDFPLVASCTIEGAVASEPLALLLGCCSPLEAWLNRVITSAQLDVETSAPVCHDLTTFRSRPDLTQHLRDTLATTHLHDFAATCFDEAPLDNLTYALSVLQRAAHLPRPDLTLDVPASSHVELLVWLELLEGFAARDRDTRQLHHDRGVEPSLLLWSPDLRRALVCLGAWSTDLLVYLGDARHPGHGRWPLWSSRRESGAQARRDLDPGMLDNIDQDDTVATLLARVGSAR